MNDFFNLANQKIGKLISELSDDAKKFTEKTKSEEEQGKITIILLYYKLILQGAINFGSDMHGFVKTIKDCSMDESDISLVLDKYCETDIATTIMSDMELYEKPYVDINIKPANGLNDIKLSEDLDVKIDIPENVNGIKIEETSKEKSNDEVFDISKIFEDIDGNSDEDLVIDIDVEEDHNPNNININENQNNNSEISDIRGYAEIDNNPKPELNLNDELNEASGEENYANLFESIRNNELENMQPAIFDIKSNKED